jgi:acyl-[acyl-carrier-protein] desaturase
MDAMRHATRVSHRNAGKFTDDRAAYELMRNIAVDENHHFPNLLQERHASHARAGTGSRARGHTRLFDNFQMPRVAMPNFLRRPIEVAKSGVYNFAYITTGC